MTNPLNNPALASGAIALSLIWFLSVASGTGRNYYPTRQELAAYYRTPHWRKFRKLAIEKRGGRCEACHYPHRIEVHHLHYNRLGRERLSDVRLLCHRCHRRVTALHSNPGFRRGGKDAIGRATRTVMRQDRHRRWRKAVWRKVTQPLHTLRLETVKGSR